MYSRNTKSVNKKESSHLGAKTKKKKKLLPFENDMLVVLIIRVCTSLRLRLCNLGLNA